MEHAAIQTMNGSLRLILRLITLIPLVTLLSSAHAQPQCTQSGSQCTICETLGDLRLVGGENFTEGRLEICYNSTWGTICDNGFGVEDATVACIQLGFSDQGALSVPFAAFGPGPGPIVLDDVNCIGTERRLIDCGHDGLGVHKCDHNEDVGVKCEIRSVGTVSVSTLQISTQTPSILATISISRTMTMVPPSATATIVDSTVQQGISSSQLLLDDLSPTTVTSSPSTQPQPGRQSSAVTNPPATDVRTAGSTNAGLVAGLVFLFLALIVLAVIFVLLLIIYLRKRNDKKLKNNTRHWYIQANPIAQTSSFEGDSIFNLLEENGQKYGTGQRDSTPDFLVVRHRPPMSTVPNAYNSSPGLETKTVPVNKARPEVKDTQPDDKCDNRVAESPPNGLPSTIVINSNERVMYTDVTFKPPTSDNEELSVGSGQKNPLNDLQEEPSVEENESEWSLDEFEESEKDTSKDLTYSEVRFDSGLHS